MAKYDSDAIEQLFQQNLGRSATKAEHDFFKPYVEGDYINPFQIGQYIQGTPEAQQARLGKFGGQLEDQLAGSDQAILGRAADAANGSFAEMGRQGSTGQANSVLQAGQQLAEGRRSALASFYGQGYNGLMSDYGAQSGGALERAYGLEDAAKNRAFQLSDYHMQQNDYNGMLRGQSIRNMQSGLFNAGVQLPGQILGAVGKAGGFSKLF